ARLSESFLKLHGLAGNKALTPNVIGHIQVLPEGSTFAGMQPTPVAIVEWKVPSFAFASKELQNAYVEEATNAIHEASGGKHPRELTWVNVTHAVDGGWGIAGRAMTNAELGAAIDQG
ncbi:MAG: 4-oxalocrotonate tautomerase family protein, partial [Povalibacter sp.]